MPTSQTVISDPPAASSLPDGRWRTLVEPWTDECPDPEHWLETTGLVDARNKVEEALRSGSDPILLSGPTGHGKTLLLRSLRIHTPSGFVPLLVPFSNVEPQDIARWIIEPTLGSGGDPGAELTSLLQANVRSGRKTLLLMDEVQSTPPATLAKLFELLAESGVEVSVVLAGLPGEDLDQVLEAAPLSIQKIELAEPWSRLDAELLLTHVALTLGIPATELIAAIDVDAALQASAGNPRLVRAALGRQLRIARPVGATIPPVAEALPLSLAATHTRISTLIDPEEKLGRADHGVQAAIVRGVRAIRRIRLPRRANLPRVGLRYALMTAGIFIALGASLFIGRIPIGSTMVLSTHGEAMGDEPISFRLNSHPWALVEVDGVEAGSTPLTISLEPGSHRFRAVMADGQIHEETLVVSTMLDHYAFRSRLVPGPETAPNHFASESP